MTCLYREQWLAAAQKVFKSLDTQSNGLTMDRLMCVLREKLPAAEVEYAVEDALVDAGYKGSHTFLLHCTPDNFRKLKCRIAGHWFLFREALMQGQ